VVLSYIRRALTSTQVTLLSGYFRRLLTPPLPGDGLLIVGFIEGLVGWSLSWMLVSGQVQSPFGLLESIVLLWLVLTAGIVAVGVTYTAPTVRRNRIWLVWAGLNTSAAAINVAAVAGYFPGPFGGVGIVAVGVTYTAPTVRRNRIWLVWAGLNTSAAAINVAAVAGYFPGPFGGVGIVQEFLGFGYWKPWFLALGLGYLATAAYNWENPQIRKSERVVYALTGVVCLVILSPWPGIPVVGQQVVFGESLFIVGALLHLVPMGFDVLADIALILRQSW